MDDFPFAPRFDDEFEPLFFFLEFFQSRSRLACNSAKPNFRILDMDQGQGQSSINVQPQILRNATSVNRLALH